MQSQDYRKIRQELLDKQKLANPKMPTIDSLHDEDGNPTFDLGTNELDCTYPVYEPHLILAEMKSMIREMRFYAETLGIKYSKKDEIHS